MRALLSALILTLACPLAIADNPKVLGPTTKGDPGLRRPIAIAMAPGNVLLVADDAGKQLVGIQLPEAATGKPITNVTDVNGKIAARMGNPRSRATAMAVSEKGDRAYFLVPDFSTQKYVIMSMDAAGTLAKLDLSAIAYAKVSLPFAAHQRMAGVNDLAWAGDRVLITGSTNSAFNANIIAIPAPLGATKATTISAETYHWSHRAWETRAPIRRFCVLQEGDKTYLFGGYTCTPIVRFDVSELTAGAKLRGQTITDFGGGEVILDILTYAKGGKRYLLANTRRRGCVRIERDYMMESEAVNEKAKALLSGRMSGEPVSKLTTMVKGFEGVFTMEKLSETHALVLRSPDGRRLDLVKLALP